MTLTAEQHDVRSKGIGGSDAAAAIGLSKWKTPVKLYLEKIGEIENEEATEGPRYWGQMLEDIVATEYAKRTGQKVRRRVDAIVHPDYDWMLAHIDRSVDGERKVLECKTSSDYMADQWGKDGSDDVPDEYLIQVQHQLACTGYERADLAVLIGNRDYRIYHLGADRELIDGLIEREYQFWRCVMDRTPPEPVNLRDLQDLYPTDSGEQLLADDALIDAVSDLVQVRARLKASQEDKEKIEQRIKTAMTDCSELVADDGRKLITWKKPRDSIVTDWKAVTEELVRLHGIDPDDFQGTVEDHTKTRENSRRFLVKT